MNHLSHAPAPWRISFERNRVYIRADMPDPRSGKDNLVICQVPVRTKGCNNLDILAAAPELLEMCERLLGFALHYGDQFALEAGNGLIESAKQTIAKAKGESNAVL